MLLQKGDWTIRNATGDDGAILAKWWNDGTIMAHVGFPLGLGETSEKIADSLQKDSDETHRRLIIEQAGTPIGEMNYRNKGDGIAEIGIKICDFRQQNKGVGTVLLSILIRSLFVDFGYRKIILDTNTKNLRAYSESTSNVSKIPTNLAYRSEFWKTVFKLIHYNMYMKDLVFKN